MYTYKLVLKPYRIAKRLTKRELAVRVGVSEAYINFLEDDMRKPSIPVWLKLAEELDEDPLNILRITHVDV